MARDITGRKGGSSKQKTPKEAPDSLHSVATAKILLALGEGETAGGITDKDIYLDGTPIRAADGTLNYEGVTWEYRPGTQTQEYIQGIAAVENEISVNTELKNIQPWTRAITNTQLSAVRLRLSTPMLQQQQDNGDMTGFRVEYRIELSTDGSGYKTVLNGAFDGKTTSLYERSHRINLPAASTGWQIRVVRTTQDYNTNKIMATTNVVAITEIIDAKLRYPHTELLFVTFDAKLFSNIPQVSIKAPGRVIRVPTTYDPINRTYTGTWDGAFKWAYSNNPAWVFYDLLLNKRFGLGDRLDASQVDKWELYRIAQYCDQLVPDGYGGNGVEPRFMCDVYIQSQAEAYTVLRDLASIFRGMTYWANNQVVALADMPRDMMYVYTRANVIDGKFTYSGGSEKKRYSTAMVSFSDPDNHYADDVEAVSEPDLVRRYGIRQTSITAIGCVRRTEANRRGRWALLTNAKDRLVSFSTGLDGLIPLPGHIIGVADESLAGVIIGGRVSAASGRSITLDRVPTAKSGDRLLVNLPTGETQARTIQAVNGAVITVSTSYSYAPEVGAVWSVDSDSVAVQQYRVTGITDNGDNTFTVSGVFHNPSKYDAIDTGARLDEPNISAIPPGVQAPPENVAISSYSYVYQNQSVEVMRVSWSPAPNAIAYECSWRKDNGDWVTAPRTSSCGFQIEGIYAGRYTARVRAISAFEVSSVWAMSSEAHLTGKIGQPLPPVNLRTEPLLWGVRIDWNFPEGAGDTLYTELQYSPSSDGSDAMLLSDVAYPQSHYQQSGLKIGATFWYRARLIDRIGNHSEWTDWVFGEVSSEANDYLLDIDAQIKASDAWKELEKGLEDLEELEDLGQRLEGFGETLSDVIENDISNAVANNADFRHHRAENVRSMAEIKRVEGAWIAESEATAVVIEQLTAQVDENRADLSTEKKTRADADEAISQSITQLKATVDNDITAAINEEKTARASADEALAQSITQLKATVDDDITAAISEEKTARAAADEALTKSVSQMKSTIDGEITAAINEEKTARAAADEALSKSVTQMRATIGGDITAAVNSEKTARTTADDALGKRIDQVVATAGNASAGVQTNSTAIASINGKLSAQWGVKVQVEANGIKRVAGIQLGIDAASSSSFIVSADTFAVYNPTSKTSAPVFATSGGVVYMNTALIQDGTITNGKIGNYIQSTNYAAGSAGWHINKNGSAEFQNVKVRGEVNATSGTFTNGAFTNCTITNCTIDKLKANNIEGDLVKMYMFDPNGTNTTQVTIPAESQFARYAHIPSLVVSAATTWRDGSGSAGGNYVTRTDTLYVYVNNALHTTVTVTSPTDGTGTNTKSGQFTYLIPAGTSITVKIQRGPDVYGQPAVFPSDWKNVVLVARA